MEIPRLSPTRDGWLEALAEALAVQGCAVLEEAIDAPMLARTREGLAAARAGVLADVGAERLARAGERGVLRLPMRYHPVFYEYLAHPVVQAVADRVVGPTSVLHLQNGFSWPPAEDVEEVFQERFHRDFPRYLEGWVASVNVFVAVDEFTAENGATRVVPGTQQTREFPTPEEIAARVRTACAPAGSLLVFDSTLVHAAGSNRTGQDRPGINHQFTASFLKQQLDYCRALGAEAVLAQPPRVQQMLGWYTRVPDSLDQYYQPPDQRVYRGGQG